jgi:hypothetical protein
VRGKGLIAVTSLSTSVAWWVAAAAGLAGAVVGTAVGIFSAFRARSDTAKDQARQVRAARREVAEELGRLAAFLERCVLGDVPPCRAAEFAQASGVIPPLQRWSGCESQLAASLSEQQWRSVSLAIGQWALVYDAITSLDGASQWPAETRRVIADLHTDALNACGALRAETAERLTLTPPPARPLAQERRAG